MCSVFPDLRPAAGRCPRLSAAPRDRDGDGSVAVTRSPPAPAHLLRTPAIQTHTWLLSNTTK